jgi:hypothetical protein
VIAHHRGYEIDVHRDRCLGGWTLLYYTVIRQEDGYIAVESFEDSAETVRDMVRHMKDRIDAELATDDPWLERAEADDAENPELGECGVTLPGTQNGDGR